MQQYNEQEKDGLEVNRVQ